MVSDNIKTPMDRLPGAVRSMCLQELFDYISLGKIRMYQLTRIFFILSTCCFLLMLPAGCVTKTAVEDPEATLPAPSEVSMSDKQLAAGRRHYQTGAFEDAIVSLEKAAGLYRKENNSDGRFEALLQLSQAYQAIGQFEKAMESSTSAEKLGRESANKRQVARALNISGSIYLGADRLGQAHWSFKQSLDICEDLSDLKLGAAVLNNIGNLYTTEKKYDKAFSTYLNSAALSKDIGNRELEAIALTNAVTALLRNGQYHEARPLLNGTLERVRQLDNSQNKAFSLINIGLLNQQMYRHFTDERISYLDRCIEIFAEAATVAGDIGSKRALSYANGYLGSMYELNLQYSEALRWTRMAIFRAQEVSAPEALYRWQWQAGRIYSAMGDTEAAISQYRGAIYTVQLIRQEKTGCYGYYPSTTRENITQISFDLVDLLLQRASEMDLADEKKPYLIEAREVAELHKIYELRNYFRDDCVDAARSGKTSLDDVSKTAVIVYPIVLKDRTEILYTLPSGVKRFVAKVDREALTSEVLLYRKRLEKRTTREYLPHAQKLYDLLIRTMEADLSAAGIDTIVFVPDGPLRTIPMAALHDGDRYLIEKYALAITPGLDLTDPKPISEKTREVLIFALTQPVGEFAALPYIPSELETIRSQYSTKVFLNKDFRAENLERSLSKERYTILHIASHAQFKPEVEKTFLLAYDKKMTLENLGTYIGLLQFREEPLELLTLSACETAAGDDKAALGLAGVAVKAGAKSALATLWHINDMASSLLVGEFYRTLQTPAMSRAKALQQAQLSLLRDRRFEHPGYWSPFLVISGWQ